MSRKMIERQKYVHPMDRELSDKILALPPIKKFLDTIFESKLDAVHSYLYSSSFICLPEEHPAVMGWNEGCRRFSVEIPGRVYVMRSYDFDVEVVGYSEPAVLISSRLMEEGEEQFLFARAAVCAASAAAGHHKLEFLLWLYENFKGLLQIPVLNTAAEGIVNEWRRCRQYTLDRAFLLFTGDYGMALKNILYGVLPDNILERFQFGGDDTYTPQVREFYRKETATDVLTAVQSMLQCEIWLPARYRELQRFYEEAYND